MQKRKSIKILAVLSLLSLVLTGCGSASYNSYQASDSVAAVTTNSYAGSFSSENKLFNSGVKSEAIYEDVSYDSVEYETADAMFEEGQVNNESTNIKNNNNETRKLIKTVRLSIQTKNFDTLTNSLEGLVDSNNGYIESADIDGYGYWGNRNRYASYTIRVPKDNISNIIDSIGELGSISSKSENIEDVTLSYYDLDSQKKALEVEQERLMDILKDAETIDQIIALEQRLSNVRYEINSLGTNLKLLDNKVDYSTIYLNVQEVDVEITPDTKEKTMFEEIAENWEQNLVDIKYFGENLLINMISDVGTIIVEIIIIAIICIIVKIKKKNKKKRAQIKENENNANK